MSKYSKDPCTQIVSFRINKRERTILNRLVTQYDKSVSETMREILSQAGDSAERQAL